MERLILQHLYTSKCSPLFLGASSVRLRTVLSQAFRCVTVDLLLKACRLRPARGEIETKLAVGLT